MKKAFLAFRCRGQELAGGQLTWQSGGRRPTTQSQYCATSPSAPWGVGALSCWSAHSPGAGRRAVQTEHAEHAFPYNWHGLTCLYPSQQGGQCISWLISGTFCRVQFHPHPEGPLLEGWGEKAGLLCWISPSWHSQSRSPPAARLAPFALVEYAKQYISEKHPGCQAVLHCLQLPIMRIN